MAPGFARPDHIVKFPLSFSLAGMTVKTVRYWEAANRDASSDIGRVSAGPYYLPECPLSQDRIIKPAIPETTQLLSSILERIEFTQRQLSGTNVGLRNDENGPYLRDGGTILALIRSINSVG